MLNDRDNNAGAVIPRWWCWPLRWWRALSFLLTRLLSLPELSADRARAILIGRPSLLASAPVKITGDMGRIPTRDLRAAEPQRLLLRPGARPGFSFLDYATHPPLDRRLGPPGGPARPAGVKFLDALLGPGKPKQPQLDALFGVSGAANTPWRSAAGMHPTGQAAVCFKPASRAGVRGRLRAEGPAGAGRGRGRVDIGHRRPLRLPLGGARRPGDGGPGHQRPPGQLDPGAAASAPSCSARCSGSGQPKKASASTSSTSTRTFYPFAPLGGERRDNELELRVKATLGGDLPVEPELARWFALWGLPLD